MILQLREKKRECMHELIDESKLGLMKSMIGVIKNKVLKKNRVETRNSEKNPQ